VVASRPGALVAYGRSLIGRHALARAIGREPALAQPGVRSPHHRPDRL